MQRPPTFLIVIYIIISNQKFRMSCLIVGNGGMICVRQYGINIKNKFSILSYTIWDLKFEMELNFVFLKNPMFYFIFISLMGRLFVQKWVLCV